MDLHEAVEAAWAEVDQVRNDLAEKVQELEEANAVIDACRNVRGIIRQQVDMLKRSAWSDQRSTQIRLDDYRTVLDLFDEVDGL